MELMILMLTENLNTLIPKEEKKKINEVERDQK